MERLSLWPAVLGLAMAMILVVIIEPVPSSLSYASASVVIISLLGWILEARAIAGPPPEVEPQHDEEHAPGPSYWPILVALGVVGIAAGLIYDWQYGGLIVAVPLGLGAAGAWGRVLREAMTATAPAGPAEEPLSAPPLVVGGRILAPIPPRVLAAQAAAGAAIAIERVEAPRISRRGLLRITFWAGLGAGLAAIAAATVDMLYPRGVVGFGGVIAAGTVDQFPAGTKKSIAEGKFWLAHLTEEQAKRSDPANGKAGFLALWWKCPHLGCTVPWREEFSFNDRRGWFRCPCHGSTYDDAGLRVFGPAPRSLDRMELTIDPSSKRISVNTGKVSKGTPDNAKFAVKA